MNLDALEGILHLELDLCLAAVAMLVAGHDADLVRAHLGGVLGHLDEVPALVVEALEAGGRALRLGLAVHGLEVAVDGVADRLDEARGDERLAVLAGCLGFREGDVGGLRVAHHDLDIVRAREQAALGAYLDGLRAHLARVDAASLLDATLAVDELQVVHRVDRLVAVFDLSARPDLRSAAGREGGGDEQGESQAQGESGCAMPLR